MRRIFWLAVGLGAGATAAVLVARWARRQGQKVAPANIGRQVSGAASDLGRLVRTAFDEGRAAMAEREAEIRREIDAAT
ncbi:MAG TPA: hypothetical protein VNN79_08230 [Actinomycetota bacterium]|nr:hypothetical protein [Actinomycetota bacterium]